MTGTFKAFWVETTDSGVKHSIIERQLEDLPAGDVVIKVQYSCINYKDTLSATGNRGVTRSFPHTPGIDAAGEVVSTKHPRFKVGDPVLVTGYDLGMNTSGGFAELIRVPEQWVIHRPATLSARDSMVFGTAGFTAAMCVDTLLQVGIAPEQGPVLVTGASGGVGTLAVWLLSNLGFSVVAATGKMESEGLLKAIGAEQVIPRDSLVENANKPMHKPQWAAAVDTVGGAVLSNVVKSIKYGGSVACCGMVAGTDIQTSIFPFILRGVNLLGIDSVELPLDIKQEIWNMLAGEWYFSNFDELQPQITQTVNLESLSEALAEVKSGNHKGRYLVEIG